MTTFFAASGAAAGGAADATNAIATTSSTRTPDFVTWPLSAGAARDRGRCPSERRDQLADHVVKRPVVVDPANNRHDVVVPVDVDDVGSVADEADGGLGRRGQRLATGVQ